MKCIILQHGVHSQRLQIHISTIPVHLPPLCDESILKVLQDSCRDFMLHTTRAAASRVSNETI